MTNALGSHLYNSPKKIVTLGEEIERAKERLREVVSRLDGADRPAVREARAQLEADVSRLKGWQDRVREVERRDAPRHEYGSDSISTDAVTRWMEGKGR